MAGNCPRTTPSHSRAGKVVADDTRSPPRSDGYVPYSANCHSFSIFNSQFPLVPPHIHMPVGFKTDAFRFQQHPLLTPPWCRAPFFIHHPMTGQYFRPRRIPQRPSHHPRMTWPSRQCGNISVCRHLSARNLAHDVQHILTKPPRLLRRHPIGIVLHSF